MRDKDTDFSETPELGADLSSEDLDQGRENECASTQAEVEEALTFLRQYKALGAKEKEESRGRKIASLQEAARKALATPRRTPRT